MVFCCGLNITHRYVSSGAFWKWLWFRTRLVTAYDLLRTT